MLLLSQKLGFWTKCRIQLSCSTHTPFIAEIAHYRQERPEEVVSASMLTTGGVRMCRLLKSTVLQAINFYNGEVQTLLFTT